MVTKFKFEEEIFSEIGPIPLSTQYRLDNVGVIIRPETWNKFSVETQLLFGHLPVKTDEDKECYRTYLLYLLKRKRRFVQVLDTNHLNLAKDEWENLARIPSRVYQMVVELDYTLSQRDWVKMSDFKRYALVKLSQAKYPTDYLNKAFAELLPSESKVTAWKSKSANASDASRQFASV